MITHADQFLVDNIDMIDHIQVIRGFTEFYLVSKIVHSPRNALVMAYNARL